MNAFRDLDTSKYFNRHRINCLFMICTISFDQKKYHDHTIRHYYDRNHVTKKLYDFVQREQL